MKKRVLSLLLAFVLLVGLLPTVALATEVGDPTTQVHVIVENTTFTEATEASGNEPPAWSGLLVEKWVNLTDDSTVMSCIVDALGEIPQVGAERNYISEINGLAQFDGGGQSGWMGTLNDWFTSEGFDAFTVENGKLTAGDEIRVMYTTNGYGEDLGGSWDNSDKTVKALSFSTGTLDESFDKDTHAYTLTVPAGTTGVVVTPTASNKNYQVRTSVDGIEYKRTATVPVADGKVITVKCGDPSWPTMNDNKGEAQVYTITVKTAGGSVTPAPTANYLKSLRFLSDSKDFPMDYTMVPAFTPATTNYTLYIPDIMDKFDVTAEVTLENSVPEGTDVVFAYGETALSYTEKQKNQKVVLTGLVELSDKDGSLKVKVGNPAKEYTFQIVRQPTLNSLSIQDGEGKECLNPKFENIIQFDGYTAYIPYGGATVLAAECMDWTVAKINDVEILVEGLNVDATTRWTGKVGQRQFTLTIDTSSTTEGSHAAGAYTVVCKELPTSLTIKKQPNKTAYKELEPFDYTGMELVATYEGGEINVPLAQVTFGNTQITKKSKPVTATYQGVTVTLGAFTVSDIWAGAGTKEKPYLLTNAADLAALSGMVATGETYANTYFKITDNITLPDDWTPIGSLKEGQTWSSTLRSSGYNLFSGSIDGLKNGESGECWTITVPKGSKTMLGALKNSTISNLNIYGEQIEGYGVVEYYHNGASGIVIENVTLKSGSHTKYSGFIGGYASGSNPVVIRNCTVEAGVVIGNDGSVSSWAEDVKEKLDYPYGPAGTIQRNDMIGSFAGAFNGTIENCISHAKVYGRNYVGGIVGFKGQSMGDCIVRECVFDGQVIASGNYVGGIVGSGYESPSAPNTPCVTIQNCAVTGSIKGGNYVGGIFGGNATTKQCWNNGIGYVRGNYFDGTLTATAENAVVGGIIGHIKGLDRYNIIENNYYRKGVATKGIGSITTIDTDATREYGRTDDPMGADANKLAAAFEKDELTNGKLVEKLNAATAGNVWKQSGSAPALSSEKHVVEMTTSYSGLNSMRAKTFKQSTFLTELAKSTYNITVTWSDGSTETVSAAQCTLGGLDLTTSGYQLGSLTYNGYKLYFGAKINADDSAAAKPVIEQINALGTVTLESKAAIEAAEAAYDALTEGQKALVSNYATLTAARAAYNKLVADRAAADEVEALIDEIGHVTLFSGRKIDAAREAYEDLSEDQKELVSNYDDLEAAETQYRLLKRQAAMAGATAISGGAAEPAAQFPFGDVSSSAWYYSDVKNAWENGLINGMNGYEFQPEGTLTVAQAIKLAAALHEMYVDGRVTLENGAANWFDTYVAYAVENGIIEAKYAGYSLAQMNAPISRAEFVHIFHGAMNSYYACNTVADNAIPDVKSGDAYADEIYTFYRAGVLTGSDGRGTFNPASSIRRCEVAAILIRMYDTNARQAITLG